MDFGLSEEQQLLAETVARYLEESVPPARVREIAASDAGHEAAICASSRSISAASPGSMPSASARHFGHSVCQPASDSAFSRVIAKSAPARCMVASAAPIAAQCSAVGRRGHMPSTKQTLRAVLVVRFIRALS